MQAIGRYREAKPARLEYPRPMYIFNEFQAAITFWLQFHAIFFLHGHSDWCRQETRREIKLCGEDGLGVDGRFNVDP